MPGQTPTARVAIDLETTGLHPEQDAIIEIGALKFSGERVLETFESLVSPGLSIPYRVQRLTGISAAQLKDAPSLDELLPRLRTFIGDLPLVGHSVPFDAAFLRRAGLARRNPLVDTFELASALLPGLPSYTLGAVGDALGVKSPTYHRALADAQLAMEVFLALLLRLEELDASTIEGLGRLAAPPDWTPAYFVRAAVREQRLSLGNLGGGAGRGGLYSGMASSSLGDQLAAKLGMNPAVLSLAISPESPPARLHLVPASGSVEAAPGDVDVPPRQVALDIQMQAQDALRTTIGTNVSEALASGGGPLLIELQHDGTGLITCLASALTWVNTQPGGTLLVSVADQESLSRLIQHSLPLALEAADLPQSALAIAELAERETYLCLHRWFGSARVPGEGTLSQEMARGLAKLTVWAGQTETGGRGEVALAGPEAAAWERVRSGTEFADSTPACVYRRDGYCFVARAEQAAARAQVILTTHAALAASLTGSDNLLPETRRVLVLDAHLLEEELRRIRSNVIEQSTLAGLFNQLAEVEADGRHAGLLHLAAEKLESQSSRSGQNREKTWFATLHRAQQCLSPLFQALYRLLSEAQGDNKDGKGGQLGENMEQRMLRLDGSSHRFSAWDEVAERWMRLDTHLVALSKLAREVASQLVTEHGKQVSIAGNGIATDLLGNARMLERMRSRLSSIFSLEDDPSTVAWIRLPYPGNGAGESGMHGRRSHATHHAQAQPATQSAPAEPPLEAQATAKARSSFAAPSEAPALHSAPVQVGQPLETLCSPDHGLILAAPALTVAGDFAYTIGSLSLPATTQTLSPTMDRSEQTVLCLPTDVPEPNAPQYQRHLDDLLIRLSTTLNGDLVAVFPSHAALRTCAINIRRALERQGILLMAQGQDGSVRQLWQTFRSESRVVLLGAGAFWEGTIPIERPPACIVIARIPFPALSDPLLAARADTWSDQQNQFVVPHAALKLRQSLGGLAWSHWRRNAVVLFDRRLQTRGYGSTILGTLPHCTPCQEPAAQIVECVEEWVR